MSTVDSILADHGIGLLAMRDRLSLPGLNRTVDGQPLASAGLPCSGSECTPSVAGNGNDVVLAAAAGSVKMATLECGEVDLCKAVQQLDAATAALQQVAGGRP